MNQPKEKKPEEIKEEDLFEQVSPGMSQAEYDRIRSAAIEKAKTIRHTWRQKGYNIVCKTCEFPHATFVGKRSMIGEAEDGTPIFDTLTTV